MQQQTAHDLLVTCNIELKALYESRLAPMGLGKGAYLHREVSHKRWLLQRGLHHSLKALCQQLPHSRVPLKFPVCRENISVDKKFVAHHRGLERMSDV